MYTWASSFHEGVLGLEDAELVAFSVGEMGSGFCKDTAGLDPAPRAPILPGVATLLSTASPLFDSISFVTVRNSLCVWIIVPIL